MGVSWLFLYEAYRQIGVSLASLGYYCGPIVVMAVAPIIFKEKLTKQKMISFMIVVAGIILVNGNIHAESYSAFGVFCALMSALMYACMVSFNKKAEEIVGLENSTLQLTIAFLTVFIFVMIKQGLHFSIQCTDIAPLLFLGIFNTGIGCFLYFSSIGNIKIQTVAILGYLEPLSAVLFSFIFLKEMLTAIQAVGAVFIIGGAVLAEIYLPTKEK